MMTMRLAALLGRDIQDIDDMPRAEFIRWCAYFQLEPWGGAADDQRAEIIAQIIFAANSKADTKIPRFLDRIGEKEEEHVPTTEELDESIKAFFLGRAVEAEEAAEPLSR